jgi:uncharacterized membrane protein YdjX (TVP38/TMEM64 family)
MKELISHFVKTAMDGSPFIEVLVVCMVVGTIYGFIKGIVLAWLGRDPADYPDD